MVQEEDGVAGRVVRRHVRAHVAADAHVDAARALFEELVELGALLDVRALFEKRALRR